MKRFIGVNGMNELTKIIRNELDKVDINHTHDNLYYTKDEIDNKLNNKSNTNHNHDTVYSKTSHTHSAVTQSANGLMSAADKKKLDGIATGANNYSHPTSHPASIITQDSTHRFVSDTEKNTWNNKLSTSDITQLSSITTTGQKVLDAVEKNPSISGTLAHQINTIDSDMKSVVIMKIFATTGAFTQYGCYNIPITIPSGYKFLCVTQIVTNGWIGSGYGYLNKEKNSIDVWIAVGETDNGQIDAYVQFIKI